MKINNTSEIRVIVSGSRREEAAIILDLCEEVEALRQELGLLKVSYEAKTRHLVSCEAALDKANGKILGLELDLGASENAAMIEGEP